MKLPTPAREHRLAAAALSTALIAAWAAPAAAKSLVFCSEGSPQSFYAGVTNDAPSLDASHQIYDRLVRFEPGSTRLMSSLAARWDISGGGTVYTFQLRPGIKWQASASFRPSRDLNADDVVFSIERQWKTDHPYYKVTSADHAAFNALGLPALLKSVEKVDNLTVRITLTRPEAPFLADLAVEWAAIQSKEYADQLLKAGTPEKLDLEPVGTGPFYLADYRKDTLIRFRAFPFHWAGRPKLDELIFAITPDASARWTKLQKGDCQVMASPAPGDLAAMKEDEKVTVLEQPGLNVSYLAYDTRAKPFGDVRVRRAMNLAINKKALLEALYGATAIPATGPIPPALWSYNKGLRVREEPYMPSAAKKLLGEAGYPEGFPTEIWTAPAEAPFNPDPKHAAAMIQADLAKIGVKAEIRHMDAATLRARLLKGDQQIVLTGWAVQNGDPDNVLYGLLGCNGSEPVANNAARWCDDAFQALLAKAKANSFRGDRTKLYEQAQTIFKKQVPWLPIAHAIQIVPVRKEVVNFRISPSGRHSFLRVDIK